MYNCHFVFWFFVLHIFFFLVLVDIENDGTGPKKDIFVCVLVPSYSNFQIWVKPTEIRAICFQIRERY